MSGMDMLDMVPSDKDRVIASLKEDVAYWKSRADTLDKYCKSLGSKSVSERVRADSCEETKETQDKVADTEDYKLIAEKALAENGILREEIDRLHATIRAFSTSNTSTTRPTAPKATGIPSYARSDASVKLTRG